MSTSEERPKEAVEDEVVDDTVQDEQAVDDAADDAAAADAAAAGASVEHTLEALAPIVGDALERVLGVLRTRGRARAEQGARVARKRIDAYQARRDLDKLYQKLGREVERLVEAGEIDHPGLLRGVDRLKQQHARVAGDGEE